MGFIANELIRENASLKLGLARALEYVLEPTEVKRSGDPAAAIVDYRWLTIANSRFRTFEDGAARLLPAVREGLVRLKGNLTPRLANRKSILCTSG